jgi:2-haloacid dehalogenase
VAIALACRAHLFAHTIEDTRVTARRTFLAAIGFTAAATLAQERSSAQTRSRVTAVAFDGFPVIDPQPVAKRAEELFPGQGTALMAAWRTRQFEYTWLRSLSGHYQDFWRTTEDALVFAAASNRLQLSSAARDELMNTFLKLRAWPDAAPALEALRSAGIRMAFLSNLTAPMLEAAVKNSGLQRYFEPHLSTDRVRAYKPDPRAYAMALKAFSARREDIVFCASAGWDAAGAKLFGYRTFWVNRQQQPAEELGVKPDGSGTSMTDLVKFVLAS